MKTNSFPSIVAIDSQILINLYRSTSGISELERKLCNQSKSLVQSVIEAKSQICISIITVGEFLAGIDEEHRAATATQLQEKFLIAQYNVRAAITSANLIPVAKCLITKERVNDRPILFADAKILASIVAFPCKVLYTSDAKFLKMANQSGLIEGRPLPESLFDGMEY